MADEFVWYFDHHEPIISIKEYLAVVEEKKKRSNVETDENGNCVRRKNRFCSANIPVCLGTVVEYLLRTFAMRLAAKLWPYLAVLISSALFSAAHYISQPFPDSAFIALFFFGLAQCWLYKKTDRIWCAMLNHALFNLTNVVLLLVLPR